MDVPGMSLFQGTGSIHINTSSHDREEEEALLEDQRIRNEELKNHLEQQFAEFDDDDDDDSSINNSTNFTSVSATSLRRHSNHNPHAANVHKDVRNPPAYVDRVQHDCTPQQRTLDIKNCQYPYSNDVHYKEHYNNGLLHDGNHNHYMEEQYSYHKTPKVSDERLHHGLDIVQLAQEEMDKLKLMYDLKSKECQQLEERLCSVTREADGDRDSLQARLTAAQQERKQADFSLQQSQNILAQSKCKIAELEQEIQRHKKHTLGVEEERERLRAELAGTGLALADAQQRLHATQLAADARTNTDALFRDQQDRHRQETDMLQEDLEKLRNRLSEKERELVRAERACAELQREREEAHLERGATVNRLVAELDAAQARLAAAPDATRHKTLTQERNAARTQLVEMAGKLECTAQELVESRSSLQRLEAGLQSLLEQAELNQDASNEPHPRTLADKLELLGGRLASRAAEEQRLSASIQHLQHELQQRDETLEEYKQNEDLLKSKLQELVSAESKVKSDLVVLQNKLELVQSGCSADLLHSYRSKADDLQAELERVKSQLKGEQIKLAEIELEQDRSRNESMRRKGLSVSGGAEVREVQEVREKLAEARRECAQLNTLYFDVCKVKDALRRELQELKCVDWEAELSKERHKSGELSRQLDRLNQKMLQHQKAFTDKLRDHILSVTSSTHDDTRLTLETLFDCENVALKRLRELENDKAELNSKLKEQEVKVSELQTKLQEQNNVMEQLTTKLKFQEAKNEEIALLKNKAAEFETYILEQYQREVSRRHTHTQTVPEKEPRDVAEDTRAHTHTAHVAVNTEAELTAGVGQPPYDSCQFDFDIIRKEKQIRQEIAKQFALELKTLEGKYRERIETAERQHTESQSTLTDLLQTKMREVDVLKNLVLSERSKISQLLQSKERDMAALSEENERTRRECKKLRDEYVVLKEKMDDFNRVKEEYLILKEKNNDSKKMRDEYLLYKEKLSSYNEVKQQLEKCQLKLVKLKREESEREQERAQQRERARKQDEARELTGARLRAMEKHCAQLKEKYRSAKKTAVNYKKYAEEKERHSDGELCRIRAHYEVAVSRLQAKLDAVLATNEQQVTRQINKMESDFEAKMNELSDVR